MTRLAFLLLAAAACSSGDVSVRKEVADECRSSSDCPGGQICSRGICEEANPSLRCREDYECPTGQDCVNGYCESPRSTPREPPRALR